MNSAIQCIVLLACITVCTSAIIKNCQCPQTSRRVNSSLIHDVEIYRPRPYCSRLEVIVILKDRSKVCLNTQSNFTKALLDHIEKQKRAARQAKLSTTTTAATTTSAATNHL